MSSAVCLLPLWVVIMVGVYVHVWFHFFIGRVGFVLGQPTVLYPTGFS